MTRLKSPDVSSRRRSNINFKGICKRLLGDVTAAAVAATLIAPAVTIIDRAVVETIANRKPLLEGLRLRLADLRQPLRLFSSRPCGIVWALYATTYTIANGSETLSQEFLQDSVRSVTFLSTTAFNVPMGIWKDIRFSQLFGVKSGPVISNAASNIITTKSKVSRLATMTFLARDALTIFGSFTVAPSVAASIPDSLINSDHTKHIITQMTVPVFSQLVATPAHLLGLDLQSRQHRIHLTERIDHIKKDLPTATLVRCVRIIPAFGIGCLVNSEARLFCRSLAQ